MIASHRHRFVDLRTQKTGATTPEAALAGARDTGRDESQASLEPPLTRNPPPRLSPGLPTPRLLRKNRAAAGARDPHSHSCTRQMPALGAPWHAAEINTFGSCFERAGSEGGA